MRLTIDNFDSAGPRDYTGAVSADALPRITRHLNRPAEASLALIANGSAFVVPSAGGRIVLSRADGYALFTGYIAHAPDYEYLGWGQSGPVYRYAIKAVGDEFILDRPRLPQRPAYVNRNAGDILTALASVAAPGAFSTSDVEPIEKLTYSADPDLPFSRHAAELTLRTRAVYRAHDAALTFQPLGRTPLTISESDANFSPDALKLTAPDRLANDITVFGNVEPQAHVKDYFLGDGFTLGFDLSHAPFASRTYTLLEEEYAAALDASLWTATGSAWVANGALVVNGPATVSLNDAVELGGALILQHGDFTFANPSTGILGGLYYGALDSAHCVAGFNLGPSGAQTAIQPLVNGAPAGSLMVTQAGKHYVLATRIFSSESYRHQRAFHSSAHPAASARGDADVVATVRVMLEVHTIDPANPGSITTPATTLYDGYIAACPSFASYAVAGGPALYVSTTFARHLRAQDAFVSSTIPGQSPRPRLIGPQYEGGECHVGTTYLSFYAEQVPAANEAIRVAYRASAKSSARVTDATSIAQHAGIGDTGIRPFATAFASPAPRNCAECELAARAFLDDSTQQAWSGEYACWSQYLPQQATDVWPGDAVAVLAPSRNANFSALVRQITIDITDLSTDLSRYQIFFANDAAEPISYSPDSQAIGNASNVVADAQYIADLADAEITSLDSVTLNIDCGVAPPPGGGIEVRRSDFAWGPAADRNLLGRFGTRTFSIPRLARNYTIYLRQYDATGHYSRYSTALHIDYPL